MTERLSFLLEDAKNAMLVVAGDDSGSYEEKIEALEELAADIEGAIDGLNSDIVNRDNGG